MGHQCEGDGTIPQGTLSSVWSASCGSTIIVQPIRSFESFSQDCDWLILACVQMHAHATSVRLGKLSLF